ncbi:MAG TPA: aspartate aminotransferase family protein [Actinomycetota bacterium]|nr:aspartate aminotransferase family protein [Actinomycetota bacterium]
MPAHIDDRVEIDLGLVEELIRKEEAALAEKQPRSVSYQQEASHRLPGGVSSSWQTAPPHPIYLDRGKGSKVWDIDGNEFVDYHNGYGVMVVGHAHPKIVEAVQRRIELGSHFAQPTADALVVAENLAERTGLPYWRFGNSGTESTLDASRLMRAATGRDLLLKCEGIYHGHHDALMVSVYPSPDAWGPHERPSSVPQTPGLPRSYVELTRVVPFNDAEAVKRVFAEFPGQIAGMIVEPCMTNLGVTLPEPGYLAAIKDTCHANGAFLAFDEVKTGATIAWGGAIEAFGVTPDLACFAKAIGGGLPCGAIGGVEEVMGLVVRGKVEQVGTFNGNPLTMAASRAALTEVLTKDAYARFDELHGIIREGVQAAIERHRLPARITILGAKGGVNWKAEPVREFRDAVEIDERLSYAAWLWQLNRGVFKSPWAKWESWTISVQHSDEDVRRYVDNFEELAATLTA